MPRKTITSRRPVGLYLSADAIAKLDLLAHTRGTSRSALVETVVATLPDESTEGAVPADPPLTVYLLARVDEPVHVAYWSLSLESALYEARQLAGEHGAFEIVEAEYPEDNINEWISEADVLFFARQDGRIALVGP